MKMTTIDLFQTKKKHGGASGWAGLKNLKISFSTLLLIGLLDKL